MYRRNQKAVSTNRNALRIDRPFAQHRGLHGVVLFFVHEQGRALELRGFDVVARVVERADVAARALDRAIERIRLEPPPAIAHDERRVDAAGAQFSDRRLRLRLHAAVARLDSQQHIEAIAAVRLVQQRLDGHVDVVPLLAVERDDDGD